MKRVITLLFLTALCGQCRSFVPTSSSRGVQKFQAKSGSGRKLTADEEDNVYVGKFDPKDTTMQHTEADKKSIDSVPNQTTLSGGTPLIFDMARRMLVWDDELYQGLNDSSSSSESSSSATDHRDAATKNAVLPRWRPNSITQQSISNANPSFRTSSPIMTNAGYASILRRNSRKKNKPSMWRHCLRIYFKMAELEKEERKDVRNDNNRTQLEIRGVGTNLGPSVNYSYNKKQSEKRGRKINVKRSTAHHEAALVAASKLGLWEEALLIYQNVEKASLGSNNTAATRITDNMVLSLVKASVRASRVKQTTAKTSSYWDSSDRIELPRDEPKSNGTVVNAAIEEKSEFPPLQPQASPSNTQRKLTIKERRKPLDFARDVILSIEGRHDIPLVSRHINPLASAYINLGLRSEATKLINSLDDRRPPPPETYPKKYKQEKSELTSHNSRFSDGVQIVNWKDDDLDDIGVYGTEDEEFDDGYKSPQLNIHEVQSKDRGSHSLLVKGAVMVEDWVGAVAELQRMNDAGYSPNSSNLNSWSEVMDSGCRPAGGKGDVLDENYYSNRQRRRNWRKRRDGIWLGNLS